MFYTDDYATQRGLEHILSEKHKKTASKKNGGFNMIRAISNSNSPAIKKKRQNYLNKAYKFLKGDGSHK